jgi:N-acetylmuramoyl-L-alanine amidase
MRLRKLILRLSTRITLNVFLLFVVVLALIAGYTASQARAYAASPTFPTSVNRAFNQASATYGVPTELLKAICYTEGRLSNNDGIPSVDTGFGCMHLVKNSTGDTLDRAARELGVSVNPLERDVSTNIFGGADILHDDALQLSSTHTLPASLADWYGAVVLYSNASNHALAVMYADTVYTLIKKGFSAPTENGELVTLAAQAVQPNTATANALRADSSLPSGCTNDGKVDYPGAIDCIITPPTTYDCNNELSPSNCTYTSSDRPKSCSVWVGPNLPLAVTQPCKIDQIVIHDTESSLTSTLDEFMCLGNNPNNSSCDQASVHYVIDSDGTVYQVVREQDIAYHDGNFWSNMHSIGIEHVGFDATGYEWYNSAQYLASAKLVAYLLKKYHLPLDRSHILAHGTVASSTLSTSPNHVDPGPYWLWDYYFHLINQQGVPLDNTALPHTITLHPQTDQVLNGPMGPYGQEETAADYNFFDLYTGPSTASGLIPAQDTSDPTDVSYNVEPGISYYYLDKVQDPTGTGDTMYEIWYGEEDQVHTSTPSYFADAKLAWLAVPPGDGVDGTQNPEPDRSHTASLVKVKDENAQIYSRPTTNSQYVIGSSASGALFFTGYTVIEDNTRSNLWYEINYNHRQAWVPASEVTCTQS